MQRELLLVEPHPLVGRALVRLLAPAYRVAWASDAVAARRVVEGACYDVLVCSVGSDAETTRRLLESARSARPHARRVLFGHPADASSYVDIAALADGLALDLASLEALLVPGG